MSSTVEVWGVRGIENTSNAFLAALVKGCEARGMDPNILLCVMSWESAASFRPDIRAGCIDPNAPCPNAEKRAVGLIQFHPNFAPKIVGKTADELSQMTQLEQLPYVFKWYEYGNGLNRLKRDIDYYFAVFAPACRDKDLSYPVYVKPSKAYTSNSPFDVNDDGEITCQEISTKFMGFVRAQEKRPRVTVNLDDTDPHPLPGDPGTQPVRASSSPVSAVLLGVAAGFAALSLWWEDKVGS